LACFARHGAPDQITVPAQHGIRVHDQPKASQRLAWQWCQQRGKKCSVSRIERWSGTGELAL